MASGPEVTAALKLRDDMSGPLKTAEGHVGAFSGVMRTAIGTAAGFLGAQLVQNIGQFVKDSFTARAEADKLGAQTAQAIKSTGGAAHVTASQVSGLANALQNLTGIDNDAIQNGENLLLTFTNIRNEAGKGNDIFNQSTKILADMSTALGQDMSSSAIQLGKALNDPIKGVTALQRVGVSFTQAQRDQIKELVKSGDAMGAQKLILKELSKEFGGSAEAVGNSTQGMIMKAQSAIGDLQKALAGLLLPAIGEVAGKIAVVVEAASNWLEANQPLVDQITAFVGGALSEFFGGLGQIVGAISTVVGSFMQFNQHLSSTASIGTRVSGIVGALADAFGVAPEAVEDLSAAFAGLIDEVQAGARPILADLGRLWREVLAPAVAQLGAQLTTLEPKFAKMVASLRPVVAIILEWIKTGLELLIYVLKVVLPPAISLFVSLLGDVMDAVMLVARVFTDLWTLIDDLFHGRWGKLWGDVVRLFGDAIGGVLNIARNLVGQLLGFFGTILDRLTGTHGTIPTLVGNVVSWFAGLPGRILGAIGSVDRMLYNAGLDLIKGFLNGITSSWQTVTRWLSSAAKNLPDWIKGPLHISSPSKVAEGIGVDFVAGMHGGVVKRWGQMASDVRNLSLGLPRTLSGGLAAAGRSPAAGGAVEIHNHFPNAVVVDEAALDRFGNMLAQRWRWAPGT